MIFQHTWEKVLSGEKTQTRRLVKPGEYMGWIDDGHAFAITRGVCTAQGKEKWAMMRDYAVQPGRGKKAVARIKITDITREDVRKISWDDVAAEGFESRKLFFDTWLSMHDKPAYGPYSSGILIPGAHAYLLQRPDERYQAWVIEFELVNGGAS